MLTPELNKYKESYNQMIVLLTEYHNRHQDFVNNVTHMGAIDLRRTMKKIMATNKLLIKGTRDAEAEMVSNIKSMRRARREAKKKKLNDMAISKSNSGTTP